MKVFLKMRNGTLAEGDFDLKTKQLKVLKGSMVSNSVSDTFIGAKTIERQRKGVIKNGKVIKDVTFTSASLAANFVTGFSTNGYITWKDKNGKKLKDVISAE